METDNELVLNSAMMVIFWMEMDVCGDGYRISQEKWDDGNNISGDGCSSTWTIESFYKDQVVLHQQKILELLYEEMDFD